MNNTESPVESNEKNMSHLLEALSRVQAIIEFNLDGSIITANENFLSTMGYTLEEIEGKHHRIFCDSQYTKSSEYRAFWDRVGRGEFNSGEYKRFNKSGDEVWINASYNPVLDSEGKPYKVIKFATDITAQKQQSADTKGKINAINRVQAVIEFNLDGTVISANDNFLSIFEYSNDEIAGKHHRMFCDEQYIKTEEYKNFWLQLGRGEYESGEYQRLTKSGERVWINASYNPVLDAEGKPYKVVKFATDVTAVKLQNADFRGKIKAISRAQAVIEFNPDGTIITANENFLDTLGYTLDEIVGKHHRIFCDPDYTKTGDYRAFWERLGRGEFESARYKRFDKSGNPVWIQANYNPVFGLNGEVYKIVKFSSDISAQVELEERVTQIASSFNTQSKAISDQSSTVADGAQVLGATTEEMNASAEELSASIDSIAQNTRETDQDVIQMDVGSDTPKTLLVMDIPLMIDKLNAAAAKNSQFF